MKNTAPALICLLLAACGGGGGGGGGSTSGSGSTGTTTPPTTTASYLVAGPVLGLEASGLVVSNGSESLTIPKTGSAFVFATKVATGSQYSLSIPTQPGGFQSCSFATTFPATMGSADVTLPVTCVDAAITASTLAGTDDSGYADGSGSAARFFSAYGLAMDASGNLYVTDQINSRIRKVTPAGVVTTFAGTGAPGTVDGAALSASFGAVGALAIDSAGNLYVADTLYRKIRKITPAGVVTTFAGSGIASSIDGNGTNASFKKPSGLAVDASNNLYVADSEAHVIRKITPAGDVTIFAGTNNVPGLADGTGTLASFNNPAGLTVDTAGNLYVADTNNNRVRKITPAGVVTTYAGTGLAGTINGAAGTATFNLPVGITADADGFLYVTDLGTSLVRKISPSGKVSVVAGGGASFDTASNGTLAGFHAPTSVLFDKSKTLYIGDGNKVRKLVRN